MNIKKGIDYFPFSVQTLSDTKMLLIEEQFGSDGILVVLRLWCKIYSEEGYYCKWGEDECRLFARIDCMGMKSAQVQKIVEEAMRVKLFDQGKYEACHILTSKTIQQNYSEITVRRSVKEIRPEYALIECKRKGVKTSVRSAENVDRLGSSVYENAYKIDEDACNLNENVDNLSGNDYNLTTNKSKVKERKENKIKESPSLSLPRTRMSVHGEGEQGEEREGEGVSEYILDELWRLTDAGTSKKVNGWLKINKDAYKKKGMKFDYEAAVRVLLERQEEWKLEFRLPEEWTQLQPYMRKLCKKEREKIEELMGWDSEQICAALNAFREVDKSKGKILMAGKYVISKLE